MMDHLQEAKSHFERAIVAGRGTDSEAKNGIGHALVALERAIFAEWGEDVWALHSIGRMLMALVEQLQITTMRVLSDEEHTAIKTAVEHAIVEEDSDG